MTTITIYRNHEQIPFGFSTNGHAGYAEYGEDIVCAGISALVLNTINSVEKFTDVPFKVQANEKTGNIKFRLTAQPDHDTQILLNSMILGLQGIQADYGEKFLRLHFKEV